MKSTVWGKFEMKDGNRARILCGYRGDFARLGWVAGWHTNSRNGAACVDLGALIAQILRVGIVLPYHSTTTHKTQAVNMPVTL